MILSDSMKAIIKLEQINQNGNDFIINKSKDKVFRVGFASNPQKLPFYKVLLPMAYTGFLKPSKKVNKFHKAILLLLPGTGTTFSVAETLCDIAGTFHGRKSKNRGKKRKNDQGLLNMMLPADKMFNAASFPLDLPLNGMSSNAPFELANQRGTQAMIRHAHLVLRQLYPNLPFFIAGRSTGGLAAISYAQHYKDINGVIAVNPPLPDIELLQYTIKYMEDKSEYLDDILNAPGVSLHDSSWSAFKRFTPLYNLSKPSLVPTMILISSNDSINHPTKYISKMEKFVEVCKKRNLIIIESEKNNLWDRKSRETYIKSISYQIEFMLTNSEIQG